MKKNILLLVIRT